MTENNQKATTYIYTYSPHMFEIPLCRMEMRSLFGFDNKSSILESELKIDPSKSPFIKERIDVIFEGNSLEDIVRQVEGYKISGSTFKVIFIKNKDLDPLEKVRFATRRKIEREVGVVIEGDVDLIKPDLLFGIMNVNGRFVFGEYFISESVWLKHQDKPHNYSTAVGTRLARAVVNIAVPNPIGIKAIDPCCGIGTVLIEALSMGIDIVGSDLNPLVLPNARENIAYFGLKCDVTLADIRDVKGNYDVAIIDMPYNLSSVLPPEKQLEMLQSARKFAKKLVVITLEPIDSAIEQAGFIIVDRCDAKKWTLTRQVIVCQ